MGKNLFLIFGYSVLLLLVGIWGVKAGEDIPALFLLAFVQTILGFFGTIYSLFYFLLERTGRIK